MAYKQLTAEERYQIEALKREGFNQSEIARSLNRHPSTINRELARNSDHKGYRGKLAVSRTDRRRREAKKSEKLELGIEISHDPEMTSSKARSVKPSTVISAVTRRAVDRSASI